MVKDPKCSLIIAAVYCIAARFVPHEWHPMPTSKTNPESNGVSITRIHEKRFLEITTSLKKELESIADSYLTAVIKPVATGDSDL
jgi:hypothetical protein